MSQMFKKFKGAGVDVQVKKETKIFLKASVMCIQKPIALQACFISNLLRSVLVVFHYYKGSYIRYVNKKIMIYPNIS